MAKQWRAAITFLIGGVCLGASTVLQYRAPFQPDPSTGHVHPHKFRNETRARYLTDLEDVLIQALLVVSLVSLVISRRTQNEIDEEERKARQTLGDGNVLGLRS